LKIVFAGTPQFAAIALEAIVAAGHDVVCVLTQPDRPAGRGKKLQAPAVKIIAARHGFALLQPASLAHGGIADAIAGMRPDAMVVAAYGLIVPKAILGLPRLGCINIHASLLPRWRGAAPIQHALLAGDALTGVTIMQMDEGLDTGAILLQASLPIAAGDTAGALQDRLAALGARLLVEALVSHPVPRPQDPALATYAPKIDRAQAEIRWSDSAAAIDRQVRAFNPVPGAYTHINGIQLKLWRVQVEQGSAGAPGEVCMADATGILVGCGHGTVRVLELQRAGGKAMSARAFVAGSDIGRGARMGR
jgi:methionyl-tRNA formyltransferase